MAAVLKSEQLARGSDYPQAVVFNVEDVQSRAREYFEQIQQEAAAILAQDNILKVEVVDFEELGMEAVRKITVKDFPAFIITDDKGNDFFADL